MASNKIKFLTILLFVQIFLTITTATKEGYINCEREMHDKCIPDKPVNEKPKAIDCVRRAIGYWLLNGFPEGDVKKYYESFKGNLRVDNNVNTPQEFCSINATSNINALLCKAQVELFGDSKEDAVSWALLNTHLESREYNSKIQPAEVELNYGHLYLIEIQKHVSIKPDTIKEPSKYCSDKHLSAKECEENNM